MTNTPGPKSAWTDQMAAHAVEVYREGASASETAREVFQRFNVRFSRNAIIGKMHRMGVTRSVEVARHRTHPKPPPKPRAPPRPPRPAIVTGPTDDTPRALTPEAFSARLDRAFAPLSGRTPVGMMDLTHRHCRWPVGERDGEALFCGVDREEGRAYCSHHHRLGVTAFRPSQAKTGNELARQLRRHTL
jgi:hypothetical protein